MAEVIVLMGVSGCGKTTVGQALAERLGVPFYDADDYHPAQNVVKMSRGQPLNDDDRYPWLARFHELITEHLVARQTAVLGCSALKQIYRDQLRGTHETVRFVYLKGSFELIWQRMSARTGHYFVRLDSSRRFHYLRHLLRPHPLRKRLRLAPPWTPSPL